MKEQLQVYIDKLKEFWQGLSENIRKILIIAVVGSLIFSVGFAIILNNKPYEVLFTGLNDQESSEIMGKLQEAAVPYKYETGGTILVPRDQQDQLKAQLVYEGYPKSGFTYDVFKDNIGLMTTDFEKNSYKLFELQDRIASTITLFDGVKDAKVTIALGEDRKYVLDSSMSSEASASVVVIMKDGGSPDVKMVEGIQRLIAKSIPQMTIENIAILDGNGNDLSVKSSSGFDASVSQARLELERDAENKIRNKVLNVLLPFYGTDNVKVSVNVVVDMDKKIREVINYSTPKEDSDKGIISNESNTTEIVRDPEQAAGVPGAESNADIPIYNQITINGNESQLYTQSEIDYLVNQIKEQAQIDPGSIADVTVSVAINGNSLGGVQYDELTQLVATASGISNEVKDEKISIVYAPFFNSQGNVVSPEVENQNLMIAILAGIGGAILVGFIIFLVLRSRRKNKTEETVTVEESRMPYTRLENESFEDSELMRLKDEKSLERRAQIRTFVDDNSEVSAQILRTWLNGGDEDE